MHPLGELPVLPERGWAYTADDVLGSWRALVAATTWFPESRLQVMDEGFERIDLCVTLKVQDSFNPENTVLVTHRQPLTAHGQVLPADAMEHLLQGRLRAVAQHEADEWIVIGGRRPFNPHRRR